MAITNAQVAYKNSGGVQPSSANKNQPPLRVVQSGETTSDIFSRKNYSDRNPLAESIDAKRATSKQTSNTQFTTKNTRPINQARGITQAIKNKTKSKAATTTNRAFSKLLTGALIGFYGTIQLPAYFVQIFGIGAAAGGAAIFSWLPLFSSYAENVSIALGVAISFTGWVVIFVLGALSTFLCHYARLATKTANNNVLILVLVLYMAPIINCVPWFIVYLWLTRR